MRENYAPLNAQGNIDGLPNHYPIIVADLDRNAREVVRVALDDSTGRHTVNVRVWYRDGDELKPDKAAGVTLALKHLPALVPSLAEAEEHYDPDPCNRPMSRSLIVKLKS